MLPMGFRFCSIEESLFSGQVKLDEDNNVSAARCSHLQKENKGNIRNCLKLELKFVSKMYLLRPEIVDQ